VALACALVATFSILLLKMLGKMKRWTWLTSDAPSFLITGGARMLAVGLMAVTYVTIDRTNFIWFGIVSVLCGSIGFLLVVIFDRLRKQHVLAIPVVTKDGNQQTDAKDRPIYENVVIGLEADLVPQAKADLDAARKQRGGISIGQFMSGYGANKVNDPESLWDRALLAKLSNKLTMTLMCIVLFAVMAVFLAAFTIEASGRAF
jgi:hypothetical protein